MTDFRALCVELVGDIEEWMTGTDHFPPSSVELLDRARDALAQPKPQGPTDEELLKLAEENNWNHVSPETFLDIARTVIGFSAQ